MTTYANGLWPWVGVLVEIGSGRESDGSIWRWLGTPATIARFRFAQRYSLEKFGREIGIRSGWNLYRPIEIQQIARQNACASGNCSGAAYPGSSSHGGDWNGADSLAIDIDPNGLSWAQVWEACRAAGFICGAITEKISGIPGGEPWHVIDPNPLSAVPASGGATDFPGGFLMALNDEQQQQLYNSVANLYAAMFAGGPSMKDGGRGVSQTLGDLMSAARPWVNRMDAAGVVRQISWLQELADVKTMLLELSGRPAPEGTADIDEDALAAALAPQLAPLIADHLRGLSDADVAKLAKAAADESDRRERKRLENPAS